MPKFKRKTSLPLKPYQIRAHSLKIVPVIDILNGVVVHAVKGNRSEYQPIKSVLSNSVDPLVMALAFEEAGFKNLYIADLDALMGNKNNNLIINKISSKVNMELMVDSGISDLQQAKKTFKSNTSKIILATETLSNINFIKEAAKSLGDKNLVVSLDLKNGKILSKSRKIASMQPTILTSELQKQGINKLIILDLARVGSGEGVDFILLKEIRSYPDIELFVGGGVRDVYDLLKLKALGMDGVLLATALHSGKISIAALRKIGLL